MWLGLMFGLALMLVLSGMQVRQRLVAGLALAVAAIVLMFTVVGNSGGSQGLEPIVERAASVLTPQQLGEENSLRDRAEESAQAWRTIQAHPAFGVGPGADFGVRFNHEEADGVWVYTVQRFLHNQWLWLLLIGGGPALLAYLAFIATILTRAWRRPGRTPSQTALGAGIAMVMLSATVMPYLGIKEFCLALGVVAAVVTRMRETGPAPLRPRP
jgi:O-antigen ligase